MLSYIAYSIVFLTIDHAHFFQTKLFKFEDFSIVHIPIFIFKMNNIIDEQIDFFQSIAIAKFFDRSIAGFCLICSGFVKIFDSKNDVNVFETFFTVYRLKFKQMIYVQKIKKLQDSTIIYHFDKDFDWVCIHTIGYDQTTW